MVSGHPPEEQSVAMVLAPLIFIHLLINYEPIFNKDYLGLGMHVAT